MLKNVAVLVYDGVAPFELGVLCEAWGLDRLDQGYRTWIAGVRGLTAADLAQNCREPGFESDSMMALILHINRELIHHGAEISLLRDLYARQ